MLSLLPPFDVATSALLISYPIIYSLLRCAYVCVCVCVCVLYSTGESGAEAFLDALFEELAVRQKSGKEVTGKLQVLGRFVCFSIHRCCVLEGVRSQ